MMHSECVSHTHDGAVMSTGPRSFERTTLEQLRLRKLRAEVEASRTVSSQQTISSSVVGGDSDLSSDWDQQPARAPVPQDELDQIMQELAA